MYQFVKQQCSQYPVEALCQVLGVSRSAYYAFAAGQTHQSAAKKKQQEADVITVFRDHKRRYGSRRIVKECKPRDGKSGGTKCVPSCLPTG